MQEILQKHSETLEKIGKATLNIREQHTEYCFPDSIYEGYTTFDEEKSFDPELLTSSVYRASFHSRTSHHTPSHANDAMAAGASSQSVANAKNQIKDILSDQPLEDWEMPLEDSNILGGVGFNELLIVLDDADDRNKPPMVTHSTQLMELKDFSWDSPLEPTSADTLEEKAKAALKESEEQSEAGAVHPTEPDSKIPVIESLLAQESKVIPVMPEGPRRDSGLTQVNDVLGTTSESYCLSNTPELIQLTDEISLASPTPGGLISATVLDGGPSVRMITL
jgi:hypothetical protein